MFLTKANHPVDLTFREGVVIPEFEMPLDDMVSFQVFLQGTRICNTGKQDNILRVGINSSFFPERKLNV